MSELPIDFAEGQGSAGQLLRKAREEQGLHVAALAVSLKVPVKKLEALEADRLEDLPDAVFVRALASSVCRALKINAQPILDKLPQTNTRVLDQVEGGMNVRFRSRGEHKPSLLAGLNKPAMFAVLALLLGAIILMLLPDFTSRIAKSETTKVESVKSDVGVSMSSTVNVAATTDSAAASVKPMDNNATVSLTAKPTPTPSTPDVQSPTLTISPLKSSDQLQVSVPADSLIVFSATGETWVEVRDAGGKITLQRTLQKDEQAGALGRTPLSVIVGRAADTQVRVRGQAFDLKPSTNKEGVARFAVK